MVSTVKSYGVGCTKKLKLNKQDVSYPFTIFAYYFSYQQLFRARLYTDTNLIFLAHNFRTSYSKTLFVWYLERKKILNIWMLITANLVGLLTLTKKEKTPNINLRREMISSVADFQDDVNLSQHL